MEKLDCYPATAASRRRLRTHAEWNVITHIALARRPPTRACHAGGHLGLPPCS